MSTKLKSYVQGKWTAGEGKGTDLYHAVTGELLFESTSRGLDFKALLEYGREKGGSKLRKMTFHERARMLKALAMYLNERKKDLYALSAATGATKADSWIDIDGGIGNLFVMRARGAVNCRMKLFMLTVTRRRSLKTELSSATISVYLLKELQFISMLSIFLYGEC